MNSADRAANAAGVSGLSGLAYVTALSEGVIALPPMNDVMPFELLPPVFGEVRLRAMPESRFLNPMGIVHGGWLMTLLDSAMGLAGVTTLQPGEICPTHETAVKFLRPVSAASGPVTVTGRVLSRGQRIIVLEGRAEGADGKMHAHGTSTCIVVQASRDVGSRNGAATAGGDRP